MAAAPVLDLGLPGASNVVGDRAFAADPLVPWRGSGAPWPPDCWPPACSRWASTRPGMAAPWSIPTCALPRVHASDLRADLLPFGLNTDLPWLMTAHIVYAAWDPILPATVSRR